MKAGDRSRRLILHVGNRKTGSTAIQNYLMEDTNPPDFQYLHCGKANSSMWMLRAFKQDLERYPFVSTGEMRRRMGVYGQSDARARAERIRSTARRVLKKKIRAIRKPLGILSAENVYSMKTAEIADLNGFVSALVPEVDVFVYIRNPKSQIESGFQEQLKHGSAVLERKYRLNHARRIAVLDSLFGGEHVHVYEYARKNFPAGDVVAHFMGALGLEYEPVRRNSPNSSLSLPAIRLLYIYRKLYAEFEPIDRKIVSQLSELPGERLHFHSSLYSSMYAPDPDALGRFEARAGFSLAEDITAHDDVGIRSEEDLLNVPGSSIDWLLGKVGGNLTGDSDLRCIAESVRSLGRVAAPLG